MMKQIRFQMPDNIGQTILTQDIRFSQLVETLRHEQIKTFLVGGTLRSILIGEPVSDIDIVVDCSFAYLKDAMMKTPSLAENVLRIREDQELISWGDLNLDVVDINTLRPLDPTSPASTFEKIILADSLTRDFSLNALYYDFSTGEILDFHDSMQDVQTKTLRLINHHSLRSQNHKLTLRILKFLSKGYSYEPNIISYLDTHLAQNLQDLGDHITRRWLQNQIIRKGHDLTVFTQTCKNFIKDVTTLNILLYAIEDVEKVDVHEVKWV